MAASSPSKANLTMPMPPAQTHTRLGNDFPTPSTPTYTGFVSPSETPQGSPSKKQLPQGAHDLPNVFDNALKLNPTQGNIPKPTGQASTPHSPTSPTKGSRMPLSDHPVNDFRNSVIQDGNFSKQAVQGVRGNENTPPGGQRPHQDSPFTNQAALSRKDAYQTKSYQAPSTRSTPFRLTPEELEKAQKPSVRRLANVTQLCRYLRLESFHVLALLTLSRFPRPLLRPLELRSQSPKPPTAVPNRESCTS